jgi:FkbM family methyltransferase
MDRKYLIRHPIYNIWLCCDPSLVSKTISDAVVNGDYEWPGGERFLSVIKAGDRVLELGGGIGCLATLVSKNRHVSSYDLFEANSALRPLIETTLSANDVEGVGIHHCVLTDEPKLLERGFVEFFLNRDFWASSVKKRSTNFTSCSVKVESLSDYITKTKPTVIHSDIEGAEDGLFDRASLDSVQAITVEVHDDMTDSGARIRILENLEKKGFTVDPSGTVGGVYIFRRA